MTPAVCQLKAAYAALAGANDALVNAGPALAALEQPDVASALVAIGRNPASFLAQVEKLAETYIDEAASAIEELLEAQGLTAY
jgi:hypothetical protein